MKNTAGIPRNRDVNEVRHQPLYVTKPFLPDLADYARLLEKIWGSRIVSNGGEMHNRLESDLAKLFQAGSVSLVNNGTIALQIALQATGIKGKVITSPYSFVATANAIRLAGLEPVFVDIEEDSFNLDPGLLADAYGNDVSAVMPVHVYGIPCDRYTMDDQATKLKLKVIYDAAHAFNVRECGESILNWGDCSVLSFHATKVFHTFEGGAIVSNDQDLANRISRLRNFGYHHGEIEECGTNGKMNEAQAAMGLLMLDHLDEIIRKRKHWYDAYCQLLSETEGLKLPLVHEGLSYNYSYFPLMIGAHFPLTRDELYEAFIHADIYPRKYFHPLITDFPFYRGCRIISKHRVPNARRVADSVLCLPLYPDLSESDVGRVVDVIKKAQADRVL